MKNSALLLLSTLLLVNCGQLGAEATDAAPPPPARGEKSARPPLFAVPIDGLPVMGDRGALVTLVELVDYGCPYCARANETVRALRDKYGSLLRVAVVENPLPMHEHAREAALAALAADEQGRFEAMHQALFESREEHTTDVLSKLGRELHLGEAFERARVGDRAKDGLDRAAKLVAALKVHGAPTFFVNGRKISGAQPLATFVAIIDEELEHARALVASGVAPERVYDAILEEARQNPAPLEETPAHEPAPFVAEAKDLGGAHFLGAKDAARSIVLFTDFECPYCARLDAQLRDFVKTHPDVRVVLRHRPLPMHPHARLAAKAAVAAEAQGRLAAYASVLFEKRSALERDALIGYADALGLDHARFVRDLDAAETEARIVADDALATKLMVTGTPTSFVDGRRVIGAQPAKTFETALE